ncbi:MAG: methyltransferase domain-containing protein, partial [Alphaproteobacteria bacterium]
MEYDEQEARKTEQGYLAPEIIRQRMRTLDALGLRAGERVLDVGCGPGLLAYDMALEVGPGGQVVGLDNSSAMLRLAEQRCEHLSQVVLKEGVAENLPEDDRSFDAVACSQVLLYVADVSRAVAEMHRVLKPGGRIAVIETDWRGVVLSASDQDLSRRILAAWDDAVPSPHLPVRMGPLMRKQGFAAIQVEAVPILSTSYAPNNFSMGMAEQIAQIACERGAISEDDATAWLEDLRRLGGEG